MLGFAVLGCGRIGRLHAATIAANPRARLVAVHDTLAASAAEVAARTGAAVAATVRDALDDPAVGAVVIATPTPTHVPLIAAAVAAGKGVLCEKPIDLDLARVDACAAEIGAAAARVLVGFNRRFDPDFRRVRTRLREGAIGPLEQLAITSRDPAPPPAGYVASSGGLFRDMTIHDFDMARYLAGEIVEVQAMGAVLVDPAIGAAGDVDSAAIVMRAASGALVQVSNSRRCAYGYDQRIEAFGPLGMLQARNRHATTVEEWTAERTGACDPVLDFFLERYAEAFRLEIDHAIDVFAGAADPLASFADGRAALALADAAHASAASGRSVRVPTCG
jgi:myo-inositol 2-dehydrogenase / D-chiro-inositol 1-dehydrogenase